MAARPFGSWRSPGCAAPPAVRRADRASWVDAGHGSWTTPSVSSRRTSRHTIRPFGGPHNEECVDHPKATGPPGALWHPPSRLRAPRPAHAPRLRPAQPPAARHGLTTTHRGRGQQHGVVLLAPGTRAAHHPARVLRGGRPPVLAGGGGEEPSPCFPGHAGWTRGNNTTTTTTTTQSSRVSK